MTTPVPAAPATALPRARARAAGGVPPGASAACGRARRRAAAAALFAAAAAPVLAAALFAAAAQAQSPGSFLPGAPAPAEPGVAAPVAPPAPAPLTPGPAAGPGVVLRGVRLVGATAVPPAEVAPLWDGLVGTRVGPAELEALAAAIGAAWRARGFVLSQAVLPPQEIRDGVVTVQVIEGFVDGLDIAAGSPSRAAAAARLFAPVGADRPLRLATLERAVLLARDRLGGEVGTVIAPSPRTFAAADLTVEVPDAAPTGFVTVDNRGSRLYGEGSFATGATAFGRLGLNERVDMLAAGALDGSLGFVQGAISLPLPGLDGTLLDGAALAFEADHADGAPDLARSGAPNGQTLTTAETNLRVAVAAPFIRTRAQSLKGEIGLDWQSSRNVTAFGGDEISERDRLLVLAAGLAWDRADRHGGVSLVEAGLRQGIDTRGSFVGGGVSSGRPDFTLVTLKLARLQRLGQGPWALWLEGIGQYAFDILPNSERFSLGDATIGRGFAPGDATGDSGYGGRIELRHGVDPARLAGVAEGAELYAFGDYGAAYDRDGERDGVRRATLGSAGAGLRLDLRPGLTLVPEIARQLDGRATDTTDPDHETRFYLSLVARF